MSWKWQLCLNAGKFFARYSFRPILKLLGGKTWKKSPNCQCTYLYCFQISAVNFARKFRVVWVENYKELGVSSVLCSHWLLQPHTNTWLAPPPSLLSFTIPSSSCQFYQNGLGLILPADKVFYTFPSADNGVFARTASSANFVSAPHLYLQPSTCIVSSPSSNQRWPVPVPVTQCKKVSSHAIKSPKCVHRRACSRTGSSSHMGSLPQGPKVFYFKFHMKYKLVSGHIMNQLKASTFWHQCFSKLRVSQSTMRTRPTERSSRS